MLKKNKKRKFKKRFYAVIGVLMVALIFGVVSILPGGKTEISTGTIDFSEDFECLIIRDEDVYSEKDFGKMVMSVGEGKKVAKDEKIAELYKWDYSDKITEELIDVQKQINDYQQKNIVKDIVNGDLEKVRLDINNKIKEIKDVISGVSHADMLELEKQLGVLKKQEQDLLKKIGGKADSTLNALYDREAGIIKKINDSKTDVLAQEAGIISFYFDGAESTLTFENLDNLKKETIENCFKGTLPTTNETDGSTKLYRLINGYKWYIVVLGPDKGIGEMIVDNEYEVSFDGIYDKPYTGKLIMAKNVDGATMYAFEFSEDVSPLISTRTSKVKIKKEYKGLLVDNKCIKEQNGIKGIYVRMPYGKTFVNINTIVNNGKQSIIEFIDTKVEEPITIYK